MKSIIKFFRAGRINAIRHKRECIIQRIESSIRIINRGEKIYITANNCPVLEFSGDITLDNVFEEVRKIKEIMFNFEIAE